MERYPDVVVVGAGVIGLSCAWRLAQKGVRVTVIDHQAPLSSASSNSLGVLAYPTPLRQSPFLTLHRTSLGMFPAFGQELEAATGINIGFTRCGSMEIIPTLPQYEQAEKEVKVIMAQRLKVDGQPAMELLTTREAKHLEREALTTEFGALYSRMTANISVNELLFALQAACSAHGVCIRQHCQALSIAVSREKVKAVTCRDESLPCAAVLAAAGAWTPLLAPLLKKYAYVEPVRGQAILLETPRRLVSGVVKWNQKYLVPLSDHLLALGSTTEKDSGFDQRTTPGGIKEILDLTLQAVPAISDASIKRLWAGLRPAAPDSKPHIGPVPGIEGLFAAAGHYKTGFGFAPLTAEVMSGLISGGDCDYDITALLPRLTEPVTKKKRKDGQVCLASAGDAVDDDL